MTNIAHEVWKILDTSPSIRKDLALGLINHSALARYIIEEKNVKGNMDAVLSAIRRYEINPIVDLVKTANDIIRQSSFSTKSKLANISIVKDSTTQKLLPKLFSIINYNRGDVLRIIQADESIKILVDEKNLEKVKNILTKEKIINIDENLCEINIHFHSKAVNTPGIVAVISDELLMNGINVMETMSCVPELLWFIKEKDSLNAYNVFYQLCNSMKKNQI
jgi:aspartokinase